MHLKMDKHVLTGLFVFSLIIAAIVIVALMVLMAYHLDFAQSLFAAGNP
jgi:heme/copper-type cytochrome/quinol oxidase subunit 4